MYTHKHTAKMAIETRDSTTEMTVPALVSLVATILKICSQLRVQEVKLMRKEDTEVSQHACAKTGGLPILWVASAFINITDPISKPMLCNILI